MFIMELRVAFHFEHEEKVIWAYWTCGLAFALTRSKPVGVYEITSCESTYPADIAEDRVARVLVAADRISTRSPRKRARVS